jgi:hypothetical protein
MREASTRPSIADLAAGCAVLSVSGEGERAGPGRAGGVRGASTVGRDISGAARGTGHAIDMAAVTGWAMRAR